LNGVPLRDVFLRRSAAAKRPYLKEKYGYKNRETGAMMLV